MEDSSKVFHTGDTIDAVVWNLSFEMGPSVSCVKGKVSL